MTRHSSPTPTVTYDLAEGAHIDRHSHPGPQLVYSSSGAVEVRTDAGDWIAPGDRAIWIPAGCRHEHRFYGPARFHCVAFDSDLIPDRPTPIVLTVTPLIRGLIVACSGADALPAAEAGRLRRVLLDRLRRSPEQALRLPAARDARLRHACELVEADLTVAWTLAELGRRVGAAERTLSRLFQAETAMTYPRWRTGLRLHRATQLLAEGLPVTVVAHRCGWATPSAFIDVYRRVLGHTPGTYRAGPM
ncbi:AraC family transcriptional regulator [Nocardia sp. alder85J]|uniref:AraC family transcriptional regulator n=1 Tax=Nocardia sp. alder85J TaxID=2862949 RepID=UPI001CD2E1FE|nr:helix-turn-helix transcriptional regulator [Nocardia sp. alder85J]MCX4092509.1 helix-turn-helix transcriptional regulator [Nocardia sp. alder85J]